MQPFSHRNSIMVYGEIFTSAIQLGYATLYAWFSMYEVIVEHDIIRESFVKTLYHRVIFRYSLLFNGHETHILCVLYDGYDIARQKKNAWYLYTSTMLLSIRVDWILIRTTRSRLKDYSTSLLADVILVVAADMLPWTCRNFFSRASSLVTVRVTCVRVYVRVYLGIIAPHRAILIIRTHWSLHRL